MGVAPTLPEVRSQWLWGTHTQSRHSHGGLSRKRLHPNNGQDSITDHVELSRCCGQRLLFISGGSRDSGLEVVARANLQFITRTEQWKLSTVHVLVVWYHTIRPVWSYSTPFSRFGSISYNVNNTVKDLLWALLIASVNLSTVPSPSLGSQVSFLILARIRANGTVE